MTKTEAGRLLDMAAKTNPGPWIDHSRYAASAAEKIASTIESLDPDRAYINGLLHDIGRYKGRYQNRHLVDGYHYLAKAGHSDHARVCITHAFLLPDLDSLFGVWDCSPEEKRFVSDYLDSITFNEYDHLAQLCDFLASADGFVIVEKRMVDALLRYGPNSFIVAKWKTAFGLKHQFDKLANTNIYELLDGVAENSIR